MLIGYLRVAPGDDDDAAAQCRALAEAGCEQVVDERPGLADSDERPAFCNLLARLHPGDIVVVPQLDSLGGSLPEVVKQVQQLTAAGAGLRSLGEALDAPAPRHPADMVALEGQGGGRGTDVLRRGAGGRPPKLSPEQQAEVIEEVLSGRSKAAAIARRYKVNPATISRLLAARRTGVSALLPGRPAVRDGVAADRLLGVLPPSALDERLAIAGTSGSGKTYAAKGLIERVLASGGRVCVVDPLGVWWGLGKGVDGADPPFPVAVFGGTHADVPLDPGMGAALGRLVGTQPIACVVDVSDFGSAAARRFFMTAFTEALYAANTEPLHLVLDEADLWAPQRTQPDGLELLGRVEEIVRRGRVRGFVPWLITQRPAVLHKDVLSQADVLVSMKLTSSQDRAAVGRWIEGQADRVEGRRILGALPRLRRGEGWVWAPSDGVLARVTFPRIRTLDSSQTPRREARAGAAGFLIIVDAPALGRALVGLAADGSAEPSHR
jgi:DNA invertase Pin-like site-specific DNA recombinase